MDTLHTPCLTLELTLVLVTMLTLLVLVCLRA